MTATINHTDTAEAEDATTDGIDRLVADVELARDNKRHATALVGAIVACHANLDDTDDWPGIAAIGEHWLSDAWARIAERAGTPNPSMAVRRQTLAMLAQIGTDGAPTASEIWDNHITRNHGYDVAAAIVTDQHRYGHNDWRHLAHWLDTNWTDQQWADLAKVHRIRCHITVPVQQAAINVLYGIDCHNQPTVDQLLNHDQARRTSTQATANLAPEAVA